MISKFIKIKNVGKFKDFSAAGDVTLSKVTIVYGDNSQGKTTLVSIIRSLILNKPELISERKTFGTSDEQFIELLFKYDGDNNQFFRFQNRAWSSGSNNLKNIEIFDDFFINENVYTGLEIQSEHQKCLYQFAIGEEGISLAREIEKIKKDLSEKYPELESLKNNLQILAKGHFTEEEYVALVEDKEIDKRIEEKKREISIAEASAEIRGKQNLNEIQPLSLPCDLNNLKTLLGKSLASISEESLQETIQHIGKLAMVLQSETEPWIHQGLLAVEKIKDNKCPFCRRDLTEAEFTIKSYQQYFNEEYRKLKEYIQQYLNQIAGINIERLLSNMQNILLQNNGLLEFWNRFLNSKELPEIRNFEEHSRQIIQYFREVKLAVENKSKSVLTPINSDCVKNLSNSIGELNKEIENYNAFIRNINLQINNLKRSQPNVENLKKDLAKLQIKKERFSPENNRLCEEYKRIKNEIEKKKVLVANKQETLKTTISQKVEKYGEETNKILEKFGVPFKIVKPSPRYKGKGKEPYFEYLLEIDSCEVNPLEKGKFILSGGDRNAFALAFFLAKIFIDGNIENKIIIFDDPMSSFDINRKRRTIEFVRELSKKAKQTILLTHLNTFAFELYDSLKDIGITPKCLQIINGKIKEWDINEEKKHPFFKNLSRLESFVSTEGNLSLDEARRLIRICLEDKLRFNYFQYFKDLGEECWLGNMVDKLRKLNNDPGLKFKHSNKKDVIDELGNLCDFSAPSHHSNISTPYKTDCSPDEIVNYVKSTLKMIYEWL